MNAEFATATHALVYLLHVGRCVTSDELADNICTNPARVRKIMAKLCKAGLVSSGAGRASGYSDAEDHDLARITLRDVIEALGESPVSPSWHPGDVDRPCLVSSGMGEVIDDVYDRLNERCLEELASISIGQVLHTLEEREAGLTTGPTEADRHDVGLAHAWQADTSGA
ncbi:MAG: Rrf2 family transcriptional regulator [Atopobiaceae bacterium]|jgi:DNA-binding IscR family transcriptional regulator|nr:Rrf2 family transcriptional regulator [Atopobiaceae bacterium]MCH4179798.1 Rrf2 family transcriptional regulator [Atopobiaceae bacterium]MCH4213549.1 Rrf2 family transcriptional regulator [Atopobiaceae bacterium]MCH4229641.1 Rrf2 family transcriptional regulator [Atopobiaceae bacterium]MCH4276197.1 Rrf2 family transcriptional regulator [Atopobiaceae bacterium]